NIFLTYIIHRLFISWLFYMVLGLLLARSEIEQVSGRQKNILFTLIALAIPFTLVVEGMELKKLDIHAEDYLRPFVLIVSSVIFYLLLKVTITSEFIKKIVRIISLYSMGIFCLNTLVINSLGDLLYSFKIDLYVPSAVPQFIAFIF